MSRKIVVLSIGRSGSSALSGMLHKLGVKMGEKFVPASWKNPYGTFEDLELYNLNRRVFSGESKPHEYADFVAYREEMGDPVWGVKDPALCQVFHHLRPYLGDDVRVITIVREREAVIRSFNEVELMGVNAARKWCAELTEQWREQLDGFDGPVLSLTWEGVKADPKGTARQLADFCYEGLGDYPSIPAFNDAVDHIKPPKKVEGFGRIAIGTRISKNPEADFFVSWTAMITAGNVRNGDTVLAPQLHQAAHHASIKMAHAFLRSGQDTLLMVDDDMQFLQNSLERLRSNEENWQYDIVSALATHKVWPPKPIVMRLMDVDDVSIPDRLKGDHFELIHDFDKGDVLPVDAVGLAFTLIRRKVLLAMIHPDYGVDYSLDMFTYGPGYESDDIPFSRRCREMGFKMAVDTGVDIQHIGKRALGYEHFLHWKSGLEKTSEPQPGQVDFNANDLIPILREVANSDNGYSEQATVMLKAIQNAAQE